MCDLTVAHVEANKAVRVQQLEHSARRHAATAHQLRVEFEKGVRDGAAGKES